MQMKYLLLLFYSQHEITDLDEHPQPCNVNRQDANRDDLNYLMRDCHFSSAVFSFPAVPNEENLLGVNKPLPKQLWEAKKVSTCGLGMLNAKFKKSFCSICSTDLTTQFG